MAQISDYLKPKEQAKFAHLQVFARFVVEGFTTGLHRSPHKGFSVEFKQHRQYVHGDELKHVDWKVWGKSDKFFIREYEEETNLRCTLILDKSGSMTYSGSRSNGLSKFDYAVRLSAALSYLMLQQQDAVGLITFDDKVRKHIPPRTRPAHLRGIMTELENCRPGGETSLAKVFHELVPKIDRRGLLVIMSDCFGDVPSLMRALAHFRHHKHEIVIFQLFDPDELDFPFRQWTRFDSLEDPNNRQMVDPVHLRGAYMENLAKFREEIKDGCRRHRIDIVPMSTDRPFAEALGQYLALRRRTIR
jgi:uncharacterized protein (DUF58 family)